MISRFNLGKIFENNVWNLEHNEEKLQEILNRIMQGIMSIITTALAQGIYRLQYKCHCHCKFIMWISQQAPPSGQVVLLLVTTQTLNMEITNHTVHFMVHGI